MSDEIKRDYNIESHADRIAMVDDYLADVRKSMLAWADRGYCLSNVRFEMTHYSEMYPKYRTVHGEMRMAPWSRSQIETMSSFGFFANDKAEVPAPDDPGVEPV
jgi:hypothetical protein